LQEYGKVNSFPLGIEIYTKRETRRRVAYHLAVARIVKGIIANAYFAIAVEVGILNIARLPIGI
jgi:hypothetical protein